MKYRVKIKHPVMGVPITYLTVYNPEQFELLNANDYKSGVNEKSTMLIKDKEASITTHTHLERSSTQEFLSSAYDDMVSRPIINGREIYRRIFVRKEK